MAAWVWAVGPWRAGATRLPTSTGEVGPSVELTTAGTRRLHVRLLDPDEATVTLDGDGPDAAVLEELLTDLWVYRDGVGVFRGRMMGATRDALGLAGYEVTAGFVDYRGVLGRRRFTNAGGETDRTWTSTEQATVVWDLISDTQGRPGGAIGITKAGDWPTTGVARTAIWTPSDYIWDAVKKMGALSNGFDFHIDADLVAHLYYPGRGASLGVTADYEGLLSGVSREFASSSYANAVRQSGADGVAVAVAEAGNLSQALEGRWDAQFSDTQLTTTSMVSATATANLTRASVLQPSYAITLDPGTWGGPSHIWVGDTITVVVRRGRLNELATVRVLELDVSVDQSDAETVTVVAGVVRQPDAPRAFRELIRKVSFLAKR